MSSFYSAEELAAIGLKNCGQNVLISKKTSIYSPHQISIGNNVRIDDFCILSGKITLHSYIHISAYSALYASLGIEIKSYSGTSPRTIIFSAMDDFSGDFLINPMVDDKFTNVTGGKVDIEQYVQIGAGSIVFPNTKIGTGSVVGSLSLVNKNLDEWGIYAGIPAKRIKERSKNLLNFINK